MFYFSSHLYLLAHKFNLNTRFQRDSFEKKVTSFITHNICKGNLAFKLNSCTLFFKQEPKTTDDFFDQFAGLIHFEDNYIHSFCAHKAGRQILEEFVFPKIPLDDYQNHIRLEPVYTAIVFYLKVGFRFYDEKLQKMFDKLMQKYSPDEISKAIETENEKVIDIIRYMDMDGMNEMYWSRERPLCNICRDKTATSECSICGALICDNVCFKNHKIKHGKK